MSGGGWNKGLKGYTNTGSFQKGFIPWNKGTKGVCKSNNGSFDSESLKGNQYRKGKQPANPFPKGYAPFKGKKLPERSGENHFLWKGDKAEYGTKHFWIRNHFGKAVKCEDCGIENLKRSDGRNAIQWANISGLYKRIRNDWLTLCTKCHMDYDKKRRSISLENE